MTYNKHTLDIRKLTRAYLKEWNKSRKVYVVLIYDHFLDKCTVDRVYALRAFANKRAHRQQSLGDQTKKHWSLHVIQKTLYGGIEP